jgi:hypothetical protein
MELSFALLDVPIATTQVADLIDSMAPGAVERFPVEIDGIKDKYEVLNVVRVIEAVDRGRSDYIEWKPEDGRPDKTGKFRQIHHLVIRNDVRQDAGIFRLAGWAIALIISAQMKNALEKMNARGVKYRPLEGVFAAN